MEILWISIAYILGLGASYLNLPPLVGYLVGGFILGEWGVDESPAIHTIADIGILLLVFNIGLKLNLESIFNREVLTIGVAHLVFTGVGFSLLFLMAEMPLFSAIFLGLGMTFSSTVFAAKMLEERSELGAFHGRLTLGILVMQDLAAMGMLVAAKGSTPSPWALPLLLCIPLLRSPLKHILTWSGHSELLLLYGIFIALGGGYAFEFLGLSPELGALIAGMLLANHSSSGELSSVIWGIKEIFLVGFFLQIGLGGLPELQDGKWILILIISLPLRAITQFCLGTLLHLRARTSFLSVIALFSYSEFLLIVTDDAVKNNILSPNWLSTLAFLITISLIIAAPLSRASHSLFIYFEQWLTFFERRGFHPDAESEYIKQAKWLIIGMGRAGTAAYNLLVQQNQQVWGLDSDPVSVEKHIEKKRRVICGDAEDPELLEKINVKSLVGVILVVPDLDARLRFSKSLRRNGFQGVLSTTSFYPEEDAKLYESGVNLVFHPIAEGGERLAERALNSVGSVIFKPVDS